MKIWVQQYLHFLNFASSQVLVFIGMNPLGQTQCNRMSTVRDITWMSDQSAPDYSCSIVIGMLTA